MTAATVLTETVPRPTLRLLPAPLSAPPYDDEPGLPPVLRLAVTPAAPPAQRWDEDAWLADERTPSSQLSDASQLGRLLVQALLEVQAGVRPIQQLRRDLAPEVYFALRTQLTIAPASAGPRPDRGAVRSVHVQQRAEGIAEVCSTVRHGTRYGAMALRLEGIDGRWRCTEVVGV